MSGMDVSGVVFETGVLLISSCKTASGGFELGEVAVVVVEGIESKEGFWSKVAAVGFNSAPVLRTSSTRFRTGKGFILRAARVARFAELLPRSSIDRAS